MVKTSVFFRYVLFGLGVLLMYACKDNDVNNIADPVDVAGLAAPMGLAADTKGRFWVTEAGTGKNDGRLLLIVNGQKHTVLGGLPSVEANGAIEGMGRPYIKGDSLYFSHGVGGTLYKLKRTATSVNEGDLPLATSAFDTWDVGTFGRSLNTSLDANSNVVDMYKADDGNLYLLDAGANAIIKRAKGSGKLTLFAGFSRIPGPPMERDAVPTGIVWDGAKFLVSTLTGFPFVEGGAKIYSVSAAGDKVEVYKDGFTNLISIELDKNKKPVVLQFATFLPPPPPPTPGFQPNTGKLLSESGTQLLGNLNMPVDILHYRDNTYYLLSNGEGTIKKVTF